MATNPRVALVTGGMGGLGEAICIKLAALGYTVVTTHSPGNTKAPEWLESMNKQGFSFCLSVRCREIRVGRRVRQDGGGGPRPDRRARQQCRHHAGHDVSQDGQDQLGRRHPDESRFVLQHDEAGLRRHGRPGLGAHRQHLFRQRADRAFGQTNYSAAKAGMHGFTKALAREVARKGVTVNSISPGYCETSMVMAMPKDVRDGKIVPTIPMDGSAGRKKSHDRSPTSRATKLRSSPERTSRSTAANTCSDVGCDADARLRDASAPAPPGRTIAQVTSGRAAEMR